MEPSLQNQRRIANPAAPSRPIRTMWPDAGSRQRPGIVRIRAGSHLEAIAEAIAVAVRVHRIASRIRGRHEHAGVGLDHVVETIVVVVVVADEIGRAHV